ncbi:hypothetical protein FQA39_LY04828 [Lamprigera yunnana]|nr:hypothetical protein FQA39_LY04828 [Lamprigera yunnana]
MNFLNIYYVAANVMDEDQFYLKFPASRNANKIDSGDSSPVTWCLLFTNSSDSESAFALVLIQSFSSTGWSNIRLRSVVIYGEAGRNGRAAQRMYHKPFLQQYNTTNAARNWYIQTEEG